MSTDPTGTEGKFAPKRHLNLTISRKDWCTKYIPGTLYCRIDQNFDQTLCLYCQYRMELNIPRLLEYYERENR